MGSHSQTDLSGVTKLIRDDLISGATAHQTNGGVSQPAMMMSARVRNIFRAGELRRQSAYACKPSKCKVIIDWADHDRPITKELRVSSIGGR